MEEDNLKIESPGRIGPLKRRDFLKIALGAGVVVLVDACSPAQPPAAPTAAPAAPAAKAPAAPAAPAAKAPAAPAAAAPKPTGTLTVAVASIDNPIYVPKRMSPASTDIAMASFGETLLLRNEDLTLGSRLAEKWDVSSDGKTITIDLRKGIKFHDGGEFTSADVKFTLDQIIGKDSNNHDLSTWRAALDSVEAPTPQRVVLHLKERNIALGWRLSGPGGATNVIFSKSYIEKAGEDAAAQKPVGTGPWKLLEFKPGELVRFEAVENHWRKTPAFKELIIRQVPEESTRVAMVLRGEADLVPVNAAQAKRLKDGGANVFTDPTTYSMFISLQGQYLPTREHFDPKVPWAADPADKDAWERARKVREAMNIAIDRKTLIDTILGGQGALSTYVYAVPGSVFEDPAWKPYPYDPARAKQLLAEAGYPNGFDFTLNLVEVSGRPGLPQAGEAAAQYWQAVGVRAKLQKADYTATIRPGIVARSMPGQAYTWAMWVYSEPAIGHSGMFHSETDTLHGAEYPPVDDLFNKAMTNPSFEERKKLQLEMGKMVYENHFVVPIAWANGVWGGSKRIKTFPRIPGITGSYNFEYVVPS